MLASYFTLRKESFITFSTVNVINRRRGAHLEDRTSDTGVCRTSDEGVIMCKSHLRSVAALTCFFVTQTQTEAVGGI